MTETEQTSTSATARTKDALMAETDPSENTREVVVELLKQHQALLTELHWAYGQLERVQEVDIAALKQRVSELEDHRPGGKDSRAASAAGSSKTRKRVEFTLQHPDKAARAAGRKLSRPFERVARRAGFNR